MAITRETGAVITFDKLDPAGHSILPTFYWKVELMLDETNVYDEAVKKALGNADSSFAIRCTSAEIPEAQHDIIQVDAKRFMFPEQGIIRRNGQITLTAFENNDGEIIKAMHNAYDNLFSHETGEMVNTGGQGSNHNFKFDTKLHLYRNYNEVESNKVITFVIQKALFYNFNTGGQLTTGSSPDYFRPSVTLAYGNFRVEHGA